MANALKIEITVDDKGTPVFKKFGGNAEKALGKVKTHAKAGTAQAGKMEQAWKTSINHMKGHWKAYSVTAGIATTAVAAATAAVVKKTISYYADFEKEMANVSTLVDTSKVSMKGLEKGIMKLPPALGSATELTKGLYQTLSAGVKPAESIAFVGKAAMAAKAGLSDTFTAVDAGTTILNAFGMQAERAGEVYDLMFTTVKEGKTTFAELAAAVGKISPIASAANVSVVEMHAALATLTKGGFKTSEASARLATALGTIIKPSSEAVKLTKKLGLEFNAQALKAKGLHGFLEDVKKATGGNVEQMAQLFGGMESLSVMLALTGKQSQEFTNILGRMKDVSGATEEAFEKQKKTLHALWDTFKNFIEKQAILIGTELSPSLKDLLKTTTDWFEANRDLIAQKIPEYFDKIKNSAQKIWDVITYDPAIIEYGLVGLAIGGKKGAVIAGSLGHMVTWIKNLSGALGLASAGLLDFSQIANANFKELEELISNAGKSGGLQQLNLKVRELREEITHLKKSTQGRIFTFAGDKERLVDLQVELKNVQAAIETLNRAKAFDLNIVDVPNQAAQLELALKDVEAFFGKTEKIAEDTAKAAAKLTKKQEKAAADFSGKYQKLILGDYKYAVQKIKDQGKIYEAAGVAHFKVEKLVSAEIGKLVSKEAKAAAKLAKDKEKAAADFAKESIRIYERLSDDVQKLNLGDLEYSKKVLKLEYENKKIHLEALAQQDSKYFDGVALLSRLYQEKENKLNDDWARKHGTVLERMGVRWRDYQKEAIDANSIAYDAISVGAAEAERQISDNLFNVITGKMGKLGIDWESLWQGMVRSVTNAVAKMAVEAAIATTLDWATALFAAKGIWEVGGDEVPIIAHKKEMIVPAKQAEKLRDIVSGAGYGSTFSALDAALTAGDPAVNQALAKGSAERYGKIVSVGAMMAMGNDISWEQFVKGALSPQVAFDSLIFGGVPAAAQAQFGLDPKASEIGFKTGQLAAMFAFGANPVLALIAGLIGMIAGEATADVLNLRNLENIKDFYESEHGNITGRKLSAKDLGQITPSMLGMNFPSTAKQMMEIASALPASLTGESYSVKSLVNKINAAQNMSKISDVWGKTYDFSVPGTSRGGGGGGSRPRGTPGKGTGAGEGYGGGRLSGGYRGRGGGTPGPNSPMRYGGLATSPTIMGEHGPEWAVPTYEPERSQFLRDVGADPDKIAAAIAKKTGGGSGGGNTIHIDNLVNVEGTLIADEDTFNEFVEKIDERLYKLQQWGH